ncbi:Transcriptional regulator, AcrR family [Citrifermentans bremense]|uniref:Transcriptional regulator, AcrR family n=1 Tax=Citrifermentans bremense TaxID=60035 RepID=A0A6S6LW45_9BACT|nr:TetR/AcrR family transcriptional regulator [Citrifermentans bremense]BCG45689.1 Transcriptional regulator, AcrR family [Citrifermentans bremense]
MRITEQAKQQCRARILEKASELFCARGFDQTTTRDIALAAGVAAGTMFNYFPSKETMAMTMVSDALAAGEEEFRGRTGGELAEDLFGFIASGLRKLRPLRPFLGPVLERSLSPFPRKNVCPVGEAARQRHLDFMQQILASHGFSSAPDYVATTIYWSLYLGVLAFWTSDFSPNQEASQALVDYSVRTFVHIISGSAGGDGGEHVL